ncbi:MAG: SDR family NAD(P)-dependent oxidoreductase [Hyphomicrobiaceae bacterium]|nr:SDR family NAD(P)-dependent oxidoreductase [Hyphomicrobiaceae bacterium]
MSSNKSLAGRIALVTGASRGIGKAVALALASEGAHVILTARTAGALETVDDEIRSMGGSATIMQLDLKKGDRVDAVGPTIFPRWGRLDILVANAGVLGPLSPLSHVTADSWDYVMGVNLEANWRLIRSLDPLMKLSDAGRAVFVTSGAATGRHAYWGPYAISKAALDALARSWAAELVNTNVRVNLVNPGAVATAMRAKAFPGEKPETLPTPAMIAPAIVELCKPSMTSNGITFDAREQLAEMGKSVPMADEA